MKRNLLVLLLTLIVLSSGFVMVKKPHIKVSGTFQSVGEFSKVYLYEFFGSELLKKDSAILEGGRFVFKRKEPFPRGFYRIGPTEDKSVLLILSSESPVISADLNNLPASVSITESRENEGYLKFRKFNDQQNNLYKTINQQATALKNEGSDENQFNQKIQVLQERADSLTKLRVRFFEDIQNQYEGLFVAKFTEMLSLDSSTKENFFKPEDFSDPELIRGDMIPTKISIYMQRFIDQDLESWKKASENILAKAILKNDNKEVVYITIIRNMANNDINFTRSIAKKYITEYPDSKFAKTFWQAMPKVSPTLGDEVPDIKLSTPEGQMLALSSLRGKVVLIDFWASWCGPCRRENPNVVKAYNKFKNKGFTVFSVSLDTERDKWVNAIKHDGLVWENHVSDLQGWQSAAAKEFGVRGIPQTFLVGKNGKVLATNLRGESLETMLQKVLGQE